MTASVRRKEPWSHYLTGAGSCSIRNQRSFLSPGSIPHSESDPLILTSEEFIHFLQQLCRFVCRFLLRGFRKCGCWPSSSVSTGKQCVSVRVCSACVCPFTLWFVTNTLLIPLWHWRSVFSRRVSLSPRAGTEGSQGATLPEKVKKYRDERVKKKKKKKKGWRREGTYPFYWRLSSFTQTHTHTLSPRHILCWEAGRKGRELGEGVEGEENNAGGREGRRGWGEKGAGIGRAEGNMLHSSACGEQRIREQAFCSSHSHTLI